MKKNSDVYLARLPSDVEKDMLVVEEQTTFSDKVEHVAQGIGSFFQNLGTKKKQKIRTAKKEDFTQYREFYQSLLYKEDQVGEKLVETTEIFKMAKAICAAHGFTKVNDILLHYSREPGHKKSGGKIYYGLEEYQPAASDKNQKHPFVIFEEINCSITPLEAKIDRVEKEVGNACDDLLESCPSCSCF